MFVLGNPFQPVACTINIFTIVIYDRNDSGLYYKTTILAYLALARSVIYDFKVRYKLKSTLQSQITIVKHIFNRPVV